jgi:hypothetical protein
VPLISGPFIRGVFFLLVGPANVLIYRGREEGRGRKGVGVLEREYTIFTHFFFSFCLFVTRGMIGMLALYVVFKKYIFYF